jgi:hypothetical protein
MFVSMFLKQTLMVTNKVWSHKQSIKIQYCVFDRLRMEKVIEDHQSLPKHSIISRNSTSPRTILNENGLLPVDIEFPVVRDENFGELQIIIVPDLDNKTIIDVDRKFICVNNLTYQYFYPENQLDRQTNHEHYAI